MKNKQTIPLGFLKKDERANIHGITMDCGQEIRQRLLDLGFVRGTEITVQNISPLGDPIAYNIHGALISLRREDALQILITHK